MTNPIEGSGEINSLGPETGPEVHKAVLEVLTDLKEPQ